LDFPPFCPPCFVRAFCMDYLSPGQNCRSFFPSTSFLILGSRASRPSSQKLILFWCVLPPGTDPQSVGSPPHDRFKFVVALTVRDELALFNLDCPQSAVLVFPSGTLL